MIEQPMLEKVDQIFKKYTQPGSPGCSLVVIKDSQIVYKQGYGLANLEHNVPNTPSTLFNIGSMSKQFTAFAIALLETEGKLSLDNDIRKYLPEIHNFNDIVTIRHLIHHTSGIRCTFPELLALAEWRDTDATTMRDVFWLIKSQYELNFRPGEEYMYSNSNYILLALICERISKQTFAAFCQEHIFDPLDMKQSVINDSIYKLIPNRALGYYNDSGKWVNAPLTDAVIGPTNVYSTVEDLAKWDQNFYTGKVGGQRVIEKVLQPGHLNNGQELDYAFGLMVGPAHQYKGWQVVEHGGGQGGYGSWMVRFREQNLSIVVLFNHFLFDMQDYAYKVADLFLIEKPTSTFTGEKLSDQKEITPKVDLTPEQLMSKTGTYFNAHRAASRLVTYVEGKLQFQGYNLLPLSENLFFFEVEPQTQVEFIPTKDGFTKTMKTITSSEEYSYDRVETVLPSPDELLQYAGEYYSPEIDIYWTFVIENDHLIVQRRKYMDSKLTPLFRDTFSDDWEPLLGYPTTYLITFERDDKEEIIGLRVSGTRVRNLKFIKRGG